MSLFSANGNGEQAARYADIILPLNLPQLLTYGIPFELQGLLKPGMRVEVSLGRNKQYAGIVDKIHNEAPDTYDVKPVRNVIDEDPIVNDHQLAFWRWIAYYYMAAPGEVMQAALPAHLKLAGETKIIWAPVKDADADWSDEAYLAVEALQLRKELTISELRAIVGIRYFTIVLNEMLEHEAIIINDSLETSYRPKKEKIISLADNYKDINNLKSLFDQLHKAPRQLELLMAYTELSIKNGAVRQQELLERTDATAAQVKSLIDKGVFLIEDKEVDRINLVNSKDTSEVTLTPAQQKAYNELDAGLQEKNVGVLHGVTGSGKTLLYINKIRACIKNGQQAILLLPEIGLTTQLVSRLYAYFGDELGVYHSRFSNNERVEIWEKVRKGTYKIVVGPRSALWLPYNNLGLIIADEEHDGSYKQKEPAPRFHARDAAIYLAGLHNARIILGSATPSVETLFNVQLKKYAYVSLAERYKGVQMPAIEIINAKSLETVRQQGFKILTPELQKAMLEALQQKKQIILFQNRRGYAPFQLCTVCGWVPQCNNCAVSLTYHKSTDKMHCHYCGTRAAVPHTCAACGSSRIVSKSYGTEKIEEEVQKAFPDARIARMDMDSMRRKQSMAELLILLEKHQIDILVGTQMVVKGLDFAPVALVGILSADSLLSYPDFRVNERAFQLMEQVSGRAGRADGAGRVLIQAYNLQHPVLQWVKDHDVHTFYINEVRYREMFAYPPYTRMLKMIFKHKEENKAIDAAAAVAHQLQIIAGITVQGPVAAVIPRVRNMYIQEVWIKCPRDSGLLDKVKTFMKEQKQIITAQKGNAQLQVIFDVDPV